MSQSGDVFNSATVIQDGGETAKVTQSNGAYAYVDQTGAGGGNQATVTQTAAVSATVLQLGDANIADVTQAINGAWTSITQSGSGGFVSVNQ